METARFRGRVALVTGGASGIGEAMSRLVVREGGSVVLADLQQDLGTALAQELGPEATLVPTDVSEESDVQGAVAAALDAYGRLDVVCNNAGLPGPDPQVVNIDVDDYRRMLDILLLGVILGTKHGARAMIAGGHPGAIVNTASTAAQRGGLGPHIYTTAKHAVVGFTRSSASELGAHGIRVNAVAPSGIPTPMAARFRFGDASRLDDMAASIAERSPLPWGSSPDDVAEAIAWLASDSSRYITGEVIVVDAGLINAPARTPKG